MPTYLLGTDCNVTNGSGNNEQQSCDKKEREQAGGYWIGRQNETIGSEECENDHENYYSEPGPERSYS